MSTLVDELKEAEGEALRRAERLQKRINHIQIQIATLQKINVASPNNLVCDFVESIIKAFTGEIP